MSATSTTPARGVQLIDRSQWRAIVAVAVVAALALCCALAALLRPRPSRDGAMTARETYAPTNPAGCGRSAS